ncbi:MAG TPA: LpqB family beta-propeller domain-containing protein [Kofleriaceae bacterium]
MPTRGRFTLTALALLAGCNDSPRAAAPVSRDAAAAVATVDAVLAIPALPGTIWFVEPHALVRIADGKRTQIAGDLFPSRWSLPDGRLVALASKGDGTPDSEQLALVAADGTITRVGPAAASVREPAVDPKGGWIIVAINQDGHSDLYRLELASNKLARLTDNKQGNFTPALAGGSVVFASSRDGDSEIYRLPLTAKATAQRLTAFHKDDLDPAPSPDGKTIAFLSDREGPMRLFLMAPDGTKQRRLTDRTDDASELEPTWSRDGSQLAYIVERKDERLLVVRDVAANTDRTLTPAKVRDAEPSFSPDGKWIVVAREANKESDLVALPVAGGDPIRITASPTVERLPRWH